MDYATSLLILIPCDTLVEFLNRFRGVEAVLDSDPAAITDRS
jgi:hypothetical protein